MDRETIKIGGMTCAACSSRVEKALSKTEGISKASVNLATETAAVEYDPKIIRLTEIEDVVRKTGYEVLRAEKESQVDEHKLRKEKEIRTLRVKLIVSAIFAVPLLYLAMAPMIPGISLPIPGFLAPDLYPVAFGLTQLLLVIPVVAAGKDFTPLDSEH